MAKRRAHRPQGTSTITRDRPRPRATGAAVSTSAARSDRRRRFERASAPWVARMAATPVFVIPLLMSAALFFGLVLPYRWAGLLLLAIAAFLGWLGALSWPTLGRTSRLLRGLVVVGMAALGILKLLALL